MIDRMEGEAIESDPEQALTDAYEAFLANGGEAAGVALIRAIFGPDSIADGATRPQSPD
jgi:hypothetical protein